MFVNDTAEIGTSECRLSSEPCGLQLNSCEGSNSAIIVKPVYISSRVSRIGKLILTVYHTHDSCSARYTLC